MKKLLAAFLVLISFVSVTKTNVFSQNNNEVRLQQIESKISTNSVKTSTESSKSKSQKSISYSQGQVIASSGTVLTISIDFVNKVVYTNDSTKFINIDSTGKKLIGFGDIKINDVVMIVGVPISANNGTARLVIRDNNKNIKAFSTIGKISEVRDNLIALSHFSRSDLPALSLSLTSETIFSSAKGKILDKSTFTKDQNAIVSGVIDDKGNMVSKQIYSLEKNSTTATTSAK